MKITGQHKTPSHEKFFKRLSEGFSAGNKKNQALFWRFLYSFHKLPRAALKKKLAFGLLVFILLLLLWKPFLNLMDHWLLLPRPETFSGIYFVDYHAIPKEVAPGETIYFPFVIQNRETAGKNYHYKIILSNLEGTKTLQEGTVWVDKGQDKSLTGKYLAGPQRRKEMITIELNAGEEKLHFLLNKYLDPTMR